MITDEFMKAVEENREFECKFVVEEYNQTISRVVDARRLFMKLCENNWNMAEPKFWAVC